MENNKHEIKCNSCGQIIDMRDLSQVFAHEECNGMHIDYKTMKQIPNTGVRKIGIPEFYVKNKGTINLN